MIISPPFLPTAGLTSTDDTQTDPMMAAVAEFELAHGIFPIAFDRRWHCGVHLMPNEQHEPVRAIADGEVVAYRIAKTAISDGRIDSTTGSPALNSNTGFVLLKHTSETGDGRTLTFYSLYMHLLDLVTQNGLAAQLNNPDADSSPIALAAWLLQASNPDPDGNYPVRPGNNLRVYRKDVLGYYGACHGQPHLHFEIFMTEADFNEYFVKDNRTQLGATSALTPESKDYWGCSYYVISNGQMFHSMPPGQTDSDYFPRLTDGQLASQSILYVQAYFHKGERYTRSWIDAGNGQMTLLTPTPVKDGFKHYEYQLYRRALELYPNCPSEGYELLRFGRILSTDLPTLPAGAAQSTWVAVTFNESGKQGYVDISQESVQKLSDADFPFFMGWQKIGDDNTPFDADGLCNFDELKKILHDVEPAGAPAKDEPEYKQEDVLSAYVKDKQAIRQKLQGFVCKAPSEWNSNHNATRYAALNEAGGFYAEQKDTNPNGYGDFIKFVEKFQFWDKTPLPSNEKLWFFHPLEFLRHFRKCGWLSVKELAQCIPRKVIDQTKSAAYQTVYPTGIVQWSTAFNRANKYCRYLNYAFRLYGISNSAVRLSSFLGNAIQETTYLSRTSEANGANLSYAPWYGRGVIQLTHEENYSRYGKFRGWVGSAASYRDSLETDLARACDSAGFYWVSCAKPTGREHNINSDADAVPVILQATLSNVCGVYNYHAKTCSIALSSMKFRVCKQFERTARAVNNGNPDSTNAMYGIVPRTNVFLASMAKLSDFIVDFNDSYMQKES
jgi:hypothetical protein